MMKLINNWKMMMEFAEDPNRDIFYDPEYFAHCIRDVHQ